MKIVAQKHTTISLRWYFHVGGVAIISHWPRFAYDLWLRVNHGTEVARMHALRPLHEEGVK